MKRSLKVKIRRVGEAAGRASVDTSNPLGAAHEALWTIASKLGYSLSTREHIANAIERGRDVARGFRPTL